MKKRTLRYTVNYDPETGLITIDDSKTKDGKLKRYFPNEFIEHSGNYNIEVSSLPNYVHRIVWELIDNAYTNNTNLDQGDKKMTTEKTYKCEISINDNVLNVTSPSGTTISIPIATPDISETLDDIIQALKLTRASLVVYELPESVMCEVRDIANKNFSPDRVASTEVIDLRPVVKKENPLDKLDFPNVAVREVFHFAPNVDTNTDALSPIEAPNNKAIVNVDTGHTYAIVSNRYKMLRHEDAIEAVNQVLEREGLVDYTIKANLSDAGAVCTVEWIFKKTKYKVQEGDIIAPSIKMINSLDTSMLFSVFLNGLRLVCLNGMTKAEKIASYTKKHTTNMNLKKMQSKLAQGWLDFGKQVDEWKKLTFENVDQKILEGVQDIFTQKDFKEVMTEKEISSNKNLYDFADYYKDDEGQRKIELQNVVSKDQTVFTKWILYNIATQYITHKMEGKKQLRAFDKLSNVMA